MVFSYRVPFFNLNEGSFRFLLTYMGGLCAEGREIEPAPPCLGLHASDRVKRRWMSQLNIKPTMCDQRCLVICSEQFARHFDPNLGPHADQHMLEVASKNHRFI